MLSRLAKRTQGADLGAEEGVPDSGGTAPGRGLQARMQKKLFSELGLSPESLKAVAKMGFEEASDRKSVV